MSAAAALDRLLRHLVTVGVLSRDDGDRYALTELGAGLRAHWDIDGARAILRNCAAAGGEDGAVFVIEKIAGAVRTEMDPRGLALFGGGRERDVAELTALAESAGLAVAAVHTAGAMVIFELSVP